jgi:hypothetical protein
MLPSPKLGEQPLKMRSINQSINQSIKPLLLPMTRGAGIKSEDIIKHMFKKINE